MRVGWVRALLGVAGLVLVGVIVWWSSAEPEAARVPSGPPPVPIEVATVEQRDVPHVARGIGTVQPLHSVTLRSQVEGVLTEVLFEEGQLVKKGMLLARIDSRGFAASLEQARAALMKDQAQLKSARLDLVRYQNLVRQEAISRQAVEQQETLVEQLEATLHADEATIAAVRVQLSYTQIISPISGRVGLRRVDAGNLVRPSDPEGLVMVTQMDPISIVFTLPQEFLPRVQPLLADAGGAGRAEVVAFEHKGKLSMIDNQIDPGTGTFRLRAEFDNADQALWPGQFATVELRTGTSTQATVIPARAVQRGLNGSYVYRVEEGKAAMVPVVLTYEDEDLAIVGKGLAPGDTVITDGHSRLKPGAPVKIAESKANPKVAK